MLVTYPPWGTNNGQNKDQHSEVGRRSCHTCAYTPIWVEISRISVGAGRFNRNALSERSHLTGDKLRFDMYFKPSRRQSMVQGEI